MTSGVLAGFILDPNFFCTSVPEVSHTPHSGGTTVSYLLMQSTLQNFANLIVTYFIEIWDFLIFIGQISGINIVLVGAILWFTETNQSKGKGLIFGGIMLSIVIEYFVLFPATFVLA